MDIIKHLWEVFPTKMSPQDTMLVMIPICGTIWLFFLVKNYLIPSLKVTKDSIKTSEAAMKAIEAMIESAVKRAPPVEAKPSEEGAPFEEYRKDLWRMAEGEISIDEFVDIWRGRKVQKRPVPEKKLTPEELEQVQSSETFKTITTVISEFSKGLQKIIDKTKEDALNPVDWQQQEYQIDEIQKDLGTEPGSTFLVLWAQYLKSSDPGKLADYFVGSFNDPALRGFASKFLIFMKRREWDQVLTVIESKLQVKELFQSAYAEIFFIGFRDGVVRRYAEGPWAAGQTGLEGLQGPRGMNGGMSCPPGVSGVEFLEPLRFNTPFCKDFFKEWELHVKTGTEPSMLANMFLTWLGDPAIPATRAEASKFAGFIKSRSWKEVFEAIKPSIEPEAYVTFCGKGAADFYEAFRDIVVEEIRNYWNEFIETQKVKKTPALFTGIGWPKQPMYSTGQYVRVKRPTSPAFDKIARVQSVHDNGIEWEYILEVRDICGKGYVIGLAEEECEIAVPKILEWWCWLKNDNCKSLFKPMSYEPFLWQTLSTDLSTFQCCKDGCLVPFNFGAGK